MKAAVLREIGAPLTLEDVELDEPRAGEVRVRIEAAGVCHSDLHYMTGDLPALRPLVVGHEGAGIVEAVGRRTSGRVSVGDRVALLWRPRCGECEACLVGQPGALPFRPGAGHDQRADGRHRPACTRTVSASTT